MNEVTDFDQSLMLVQALKSVDSVITIIDQSCHFVFVNEAACRMFGRMESQLLGELLQEFLSPKLSCGRRKTNIIPKENSYSFYFWSDCTEAIAGTAGGPRWVVGITTFTLLHAGTKCLVLTCHEKKRIENKNPSYLWHAFHDPLTGSKNQAALYREIEGALDQSVTTKKSIAIITMDIDGFGDINETYGHLAGDKFLAHCAKQLRSAMRTNDTVFRVGGDEFVILCDDIDNTNGVFQLGERLATEIQRPFVIDRDEIVATACMGVEVGNGFTHEAHSILLNAETALHKAKQMGNDNFLMFTPQMLEGRTEQSKILTGLHQAIERDELYFVLQPIVSMDSCSPIGAEVLMRWNSGGSEVPPSLFIPFAESSRLIVNIDLWIFQKTCELQVRWNQQFSENSINYLSVNVSSRHLSDKNMAQNYRRILESTGADPQKLLIEITETAIMADVETSLNQLHELGEIGLKLAIDDFGSGHSSLGQLLRLPVDSLKIDRLFISQIASSKEYQVITSTVIKMARSLGLTVIAEGIETDAQHLIISDFGCHYAQGYLFGRPMSPQAFEERVLPCLNERQLATEVDRLVHINTGARCINAESGPTA